MKILRHLLAISTLLIPVTTQAATPRPNVLFIALDDLNDWIGCMGGNPQSITPNFDRLAASGQLFTNAHCVAPACNPSRTAIMTGRSTHRTGVYDNRQNMRTVLPREKILPAYFSDNGYWSGGAGKILHYFIDAPSWDEYFPEKSTENPLPETLYPDKRPLTLPVGGPWQYIETDWGPLDTTDEKFGGDYAVSEWVGKQLSKKHDKPFFLACGIYRPHEPWFVPQKYFEPFPLDSIELPPAYRADDLDDVPSIAQKIARNRYFEHIQKQGQWKKGVQGYLASIHFADAMLGRVLDALESGPNREQTLVVLWSDHGWHLGSKEHWQKYTAWRQCTRVPLMVRVPPKLSPVLPEGTKAGTRCEQPVSLISLFPTLTELCGLPGKAGVDGTSILPLLKDPEKPLDPVAITYLADVGDIGISGKDWRYLRYHDGSEELYQIKKDPYEWDNLAGDPQYTATLEEYRKHIPQHFIAKPEVPVSDLPALTWHAAKEGETLPISPSDGGSMRLVVVNQSGRTIKVHRIGTTGKMEFISEIAADQEGELKSAPGAAWSVTDAVTDKTLGHFLHHDRIAKVIVPATP